jgi:hypothetical protein
MDGMALSHWYRKTDIHRTICKINFRRESIKKKVDGKETEEIIIKY